MAWRDVQNKCFRICLTSDFHPPKLPEFTYETSAQSTPSPASSVLSSPEPLNNFKSRSPGKKSKVPRPPNAFILYRQKNHPLLKEMNPEMHNNDISVILGKQWKAEPEYVKAEFRARADKIKKQHALENPGYQYAPRKPSEKKRRMTARKLAQLQAIEAEFEGQLLPGNGLHEMADHERSESEGAIMMGDSSDDGALARVNSSQSSAAHTLGITSSASASNGVDLDTETMELSATLPASQPQLDQALQNYSAPPQTYGTVTFNDLSQDFIQTSTAQSTLNDQDFLNSLIDWEGIKADLEIFQQATGEETEELQIIESGNTLDFSDEAALAEFQQELDRVMKLV